MSAPQSPPPAETSGALLANAALWVCVMAWGAIFPAIQYLLPRWDPISLTWSRVGLGFLVVTTYLVLRHGRRSIPAGVPWRRVALIGCFGIGGNTLLISLGVQYAGALSTAIVAASAPAVAAVMARLMLKDSGSVRVGVVLAVAGGLVVALGGAQRGIEFLGGEALVFAAMIVWTWYLLACQSWLRGLTRLQVTSFTGFFGTVSLLAVAGIVALVAPESVRMDFAPATLAWVLYLGMASGGFMILLWHFGIMRLGVPVAAITYNMVPVLSIVLAVFWLDSVPSLYQLAGGALILAGVLWSQSASLRRRRG